MSGRGRRGRKDKDKEKDKEEEELEEMEKNNDEMEKSLNKFNRAYAALQRMTGIRDSSSQEEPVQEEPLQDGDLIDGGVYSASFGDDDSSLTDASPYVSTPSGGISSSEGTNNTNQSLMSLSPLQQLAASLTPEQISGLALLAQQQSSQSEQQVEQQQQQQQQPLVYRPSSNVNALRAGLKSTPSNPRESNENSLNDFSGVKELENGRFTKFKNKDARESIGKGFNEQKIIDTFIEIYTKSPTFLPPVSIKDVKYNFDYGIPVDDNDELSEEMKSYYTWLRASINAIDTPNFYTFGGAKTTDYTTIKTAYKNLVKLVQDSLTNVVFVLEQCKWNGENIGSNKSTILDEAISVFSGAYSKESVLAKAFLFPFIRAASHFHNTLGKTIESYYGPDIRKAVGTSIKVDAFDRKILSANTYILSNVEDEKLDAKIKRKKRDTDMENLTIVGVMLSEELIRKVLRETLYEKEVNIENDEGQVIGKTKGKVTLRGCLGILHCCKNNLVSLFDSINIFEESLKNHATLESALTELKFASLPKAQKIKVDFKLKFKSVKDKYEGACMLARHVFCGINYNLRPTIDLKGAMKRIISVKRDKQQEFKFGQATLKVNGSNKLAMFENATIKAIRPFTEEGFVEQQRGAQ